MLLELKKNWIEKGYFIEKKLSELPEAKKDWFDNLEKLVIDFDETSKKFSSLNLKSADALIFDNDVKFKFIEFKKLINNNEIRIFLKELYLSLKVQESYSLLRYIVNEKWFWTKKNRDNFNKTSSRFIFSFKIDNLDYRLQLLLDMETAWLEDYEKTLEKVIWIETKEIEKYI